MEPFKNNLNQKGFTLLEITIAVAIIVVIVAIAVPRLLTAKQDSLKAAACGTVVNLNNALTRADLKGIGSIPGLTDGPANEAANYLFGQNLVENAPAKTENLYPYIWIETSEGTTHFVCETEGNENPYDPDPTPTPPGGDDNGGGVGDPQIVLQDYTFNPVMMTLMDIGHMYNWDSWDVPGLEGTWEAYTLPEGVIPGVPPEYTVQSEPWVEDTVYGSNTPQGYHVYLTGYVDGVYYDHELIATVSNNDTGPMGFGDLDDSYTLTGLASLLPAGQLSALMNTYQIGSSTMSMGSSSPPYEDHALSYYTISNGMTDFYPDSLWAQNNDAFAGATLVDTGTFQNTYSVTNAYTQNGAFDPGLYGTSSIDQWLTNYSNVYGSPSSSVSVPKLVQDPSTWAIDDLYDYAVYVSGWNSEGMSAYYPSGDPAYYDPGSYESFTNAGWSLPIYESQDAWAQQNFGIPTWDMYMEYIVGGEAGKTQFARDNGYANWDTFYAHEVAPEVIPSEADRKTALANLINGSTAALSQVGYTPPGGVVGSNLWESGVTAQNVGQYVPTNVFTDPYTIAGIRQFDNIQMGYNPATDVNWVKSQALTNYINDPHLTDDAARVAVVALSNYYQNTYPNITDFGSPVTDQSNGGGTYMSYYDQEGNWLSQADQDNPFTEYNDWAPQEIASRQAAIKNNLIQLANTHPDAFIGVDLRWTGVTFSPEEIAQINPEAYANMLLP